MNKIRYLAATLMATTITLAGAAPAMADPVVTTSMGYVPTAGARGDVFDVMASGCLNLGGDAYFGGYIINTERPEPVFAADLTTDGTWKAHIDLTGAPLETLTTYAYCAKGPVSSPTDDNMLWVSAPYTFTVSDQMDSRMSFRAGRTAQIDEQALTVDPEALPTVDRMGIGGDAAAALKAKVDAHVSTVGQISRLYRTFFGRSASSADLKYWGARLDRHASPATIARQFAASSEFKREYAKMSDGAYVDAISENAFGHAASPEVRSTLVSQLRRHRTTRALVALTIANSSESVELSDDANYVITAYEVLAGRAPRAAEITAQTTLLQTTLTPRVQVVENVAMATTR